MRRVGHLGEIRVVQVRCEIENTGSLHFQFDKSRGFFAPADWPNATVEPANKAAATKALETRPRYITISFRRFFSSRA
jgi:hypothetical protein